MLGALRGHGWVITSEEQDTHELFHVLTSTIEDEILSGAPVPSLLDVSWLDVRQEETPDEGVALKAAVWKLNTTTDTLTLRSSVFVKEELNGILCGHMEDLAHFRLSEERGGEGSERSRSEKIGAKFASLEGGKKCKGSEACDGCDCSNSEGVPSCDKEGCESCAMLSGQCSDNTQDVQQEGVITNRLSSRNSRREKTGDMEWKPEGVVEGSDVRSCAITLNCDTKNVIPNTPLHKPAIKRTPEVDGTQGTDITRKRSRSEHQHDIPFRGYLASQLQCTICGHKVCI